MEGQLKLLILAAKGKLHEVEARDDEQYNYRANDRARGLVDHLEAALEYWQELQDSLNS